MFIWSDECSVERGRGKAQEWCFRTTAQKYDPEMVQTYKTGKDMKVIVWGCFWDLSRSDLYVLDRDFKSKKHGYSAQSYLTVLRDQVGLYYADYKDAGYIFMQDNASIYTAQSVS